MDKIEFEELSLKSMDPSLGPKLSNFGKGGVEVGERASSVRQSTTFVSFSAYA